jgi:hypothetical protein
VTNHDIPWFVTHIVFVIHISISGTERLTIQSLITRAVIILVAMILVFILYFTVNLLFYILVSGVVTVVAVVVFTLFLSANTGVA